MRHTRIVTTHDNNNMISLKRRSIVRDKIPVPSKQQNIYLSIII